MPPNTSQEAQIAVLEKTVELQERQLRDLWRELKEMQLRADERLESLTLDFNKKLETINTNVTDVLTTVNQAQGGWKMLLLVGGASATAGGLLATALGFFKR